MFAKSKRKYIISKIKELGKDVEVNELKDERGDYVEVLVKDDELELEITGVRFKVKYIGKNNLSVDEYGE